MYCICTLRQAFKMKSQQMHLTNFCYPITHKNTFIVHRCALSCAVWHWNGVITNERKKCLTHACTMYHMPITYSFHALSLFAACNENLLPLFSLLIVSAFDFTLPKICNFCCDLLDSASWQSPHIYRRNFESVPKMIFRNLTLCRQTYMVCNPFNILWNTLFHFLAQLDEKIIWCVVSM